MIKNVQIEELFETDYVDSNPYKIIRDFKINHKEEFEKACETLKQERIKDANESCKLQSNCTKCAKTYMELDCNFTPCNYIKQTYGIVIKNKIYKLTDIITFPYGTKFENIETGTIYIMEQQLKILESDGTYNYPSLDKDSFEEGYRLA